MSNLTNLKLRKMIMKELAKMVGEDALVSKSADSHITGVKDDNYPLGEKEGVCEQCGGMTYEKECMECGYMNKGASMLREGDCGCASDCDCRSNYSSEKVYPYENSTDEIDYHGIMARLLGMHTGVSHSHDHTSQNLVKSHHSGAYMSKSQLFKVHEYSGKLYDMIPEGHNLEDWMRTKISQISDDISEVYHALKHDIYQGK